MSSLTSSKVIELTSNHASDTLPATLLVQVIKQRSASLSDVNVAKICVQSLVPDNFEDATVVPITPTESYCRIFINVEFVATLYVFTKHESLYFVLGFRRIPYFDVSVSNTHSHVHVLAVHLHVTSVVDTFTVNLHVLVTVESNLKEQEQYNEQDND